MTANQEEALYDFLDKTIGIFDLDAVVSYVGKIESRRIAHLAGEIEAFINMRNLAFPAGNKRWETRRSFFEKISFVISPTRLELVNGILIPGHRCVPFANAGLLPHEYDFSWQGSPVPFTTTEGPPEEFYPYYSIFGEEYAPQYIARDNSKNEEAFNSDPYDDPPEVSVKTLDMRNIYREASFVPGDRFLVSTQNWKTGLFDLKKVKKDEWDEAELRAWKEAAEAGFEKSFSDLGPASCTEDQIAYAYWYGGKRMREGPAYSLEDFLYAKTEKIETVAYGIESRFWYAGREIPDRKDLDPGNMRPDRTPVEQMLHRLKIPVSEYVVQSYIRDAIYRGDEDAEIDVNIIKRIVPKSTGMKEEDCYVLLDYIRNVLDEFQDDYNPFTDKAVGPVRSRMGELHTAVIELASQLSRGDIDAAWLPRHTFIILSQIQNHTAAVLEDLDTDDVPSAAELEVIDSSLESMIETYEDLKELIDEALDSFRRNKLTVIRAGSSSGSVTEWLIQLSISGIDVWRRIIVNEDCTLAELHQIIQTAYKWRSSQNYRFKPDKNPGGKNIFPPAKTIQLQKAGQGSSQKETLDLDASIKILESKKTVELLYEYGEKWVVRIMILSRQETPGTKPVRCVAGAGTAPPESIDGPFRFKRVLSALEGGNNMERLGARRELGPDFVQDDFDLDACNQSLSAIFQANRKKNDQRE